MYFVSISQNGHLAFTGRHFVHIFSTKLFDVSKKSILKQFEDSEALTSLNLRLYVPKTFTGRLDRISGLSCSISEDSTKLVVVDSERNVYIFNNTEPGSITSSDWELFTSFKMDAQVLRGQFDKATNYLFLIDRHGSVYISEADTPDSISKPTQLIRHCALTQDLIQDQTGKLLFTCNALSSITYSAYPESDPTKINTFSFGPDSHPLVNISLFHSDKNVLATHCNGVLNLWDLERKRIIETFNVFKAAHGVAHQKSEEQEVRRLKLSEVYGHVYFAVKITTYKEIMIFELHLAEKRIRKIGQVQMKYEHSDFVWYDDLLYVYNPHNESTTLMKKFKVTTQGVIYDPEFAIPTIDRHHLDFQSFVDFNKDSKLFNKYYTSEQMSLWHEQNAKNLFKKAGIRAAKKATKVLSSVGCLEENKSSGTFTTVEEDDDDDLTKEMSGLSTSSGATMSTDGETAAGTSKKVGFSKSVKATEGEAQ